MKNSIARYFSTILRVSLFLVQENLPCLNKLDKDKLPKSMTHKDHYLPFRAKLASIEQRIEWSRAKEDSFSYHQLLVGLDLLGNEKEMPYCPFDHPDFLKFLVKERKARKGHFGFRYHCGEWDHNDPKPTKALLAHMAISSGTISRVLAHVREKERGWRNGICPLRIGHGVAFRHFMGAHVDQLDENGNVVIRPEVELKLERKVLEALTLMRELAVPIEINLTSNHILVEFEAGFHADLLHEGYTLVLCTDNHGIWNCSQDLQDNGLFRFPSLAGEYYAALRGLRDPSSCSSISLLDVGRLVYNGIRACFDFEAGEESGVHARFRRAVKQIISRCDLKVKGQMSHREKVELQTFFSETEGEAEARPFPSVAEAMEEVVEEDKEGKEAEEEEDDRGQEVEEEVIEGMEGENVKPTKRRFLSGAEGLVCFLNIGIDGCILL